MVYRTGDNNFGTAKWIVDATAGQGTHTTIATALTSASSGDTIFIRPGTYTENLTLKAGVNLTGFECDGSSYSDSSTVTTNVTIVGKLTCTFTGQVSMSGIQLQTNSDNSIVSSGSQTTRLFLSSCYIACTNHTGITSSNANFRLNCYYCNGDLGTTGIAFFSATAGAFNLDYCNFTNVGNSATASVIDGSGLVLTDSGFANSITTANSGTVTSVGSNIGGSVIFAGTGGGTFQYTSVSARSTDSAISIGTGTSCTLEYCIINSTNTNAITGAGSVTYSGLTFTGTSSIINTTTQASNYMNLGKYKASKQPCFNAYLSSNASSVTGDNTTYTVAFDSVNFDQDSNFASHTFTAPVTGKYLLTANIALFSLGAAHTSGFIQITTTALTYQTGIINVGTARDLGSGSNEYGFTASAVVAMTAADTAIVKVTVSGSTKTVGVVGSNGQTNFTGILLS